MSNHSSTVLNTYPATIFPPENVICFLRLLRPMYIQMHFRLDFFMEANTMDPDLTAPTGAV